MGYAIISMHKKNATVFDWQCVMYVRVMLVVILDVSTHTSDFK